EGDDVGAQAVPEGAVEGAAVQVPVDVLEVFGGHAEDRAADDGARHEHRGEGPGVVDPRAGEDGHAVQPEVERDREGQAGVDPEQREERDEHAEREGQGDTRGTVFDGEDGPQDAAHPAHGRAARSPPRADAGIRKCSWASAGSGTTPSAVFKVTCGSPSAKAPTTRRGRSQNTARSLTPSRVSGG